MENSYFNAVGEGHFDCNGCINAEGRKKSKPKKTQHHPKCSINLVGEGVQKSKKKGSKVKKPTLKSQNKKSKKSGSKSNKPSWPKLVSEYYKKTKNMPEASRMASVKYQKMLNNLKIKKI